jgi:soluble lytic murein transglycosylase
VRLGGLAFLDGDYTSASRVFESLRQRHNGLHRQQAAYWSAKSQLRMGLDTGARALLQEVWEADPLSLYGFRAAELLGGPPRPVPLAAPPGDEPGLETEIAAALDRLDLLEELGLTAQAALENERMRAHFSAREGGLYALAEAFNARGDTFAGILLGREIHRREGAWNVRLLRIVYPFPFRDLVMEHARRRGLDPFLVAGLIRQESMWDAGIGSPAGATGLMQIMPATGRGLARRARLSGYQQSWLRRPDVNLQLGTMYLAELMQRYGGNVIDVLAAYNAGPSRLARWRHYPEYQYPELFAERIPFEETRNYVRVVQQNARLYAALYGDTGFELGRGE